MRPSKTSTISCTSFEPIGLYLSQPPRVRVFSRLVLSVRISPRNVIRSSAMMASSAIYMYDDVLDFDRDTEIKKMDLISFEDEVVLALFAPTVVLTLLEE